LSPAGRGQVVSHNLYPEWELDAVSKSVAAGISGAGITNSVEDEQGASEGTWDHPDSRPQGAHKTPAVSSGLAAEVQALKEKLALLTQRLEKLEQVFEKELGNGG
jgi:hypothetical protein